MTGPLNLTDQERRVLDRVDQALANAVELRSWWLERDTTNTYPNRYDEAFVFNRPEDTSFGFIGNAPVGGRSVPVNGNVQEMFYDAPKAIAGRQESAVEWMCQQVREFVLHYFMRVSDYRQPQQKPEEGSRESAFPLNLFSRCPRDNPEASGFGFTQLFYKRTGSGEIGRFPADQAEAIVNLMEIGDKYEWILLKNPIFNFDARVTPLGPNGPQFILPLPVFNYLAVSRDFVVDERDPLPGYRGRFGLGYAFVNDDQRHFLAYGPGQLEPAFEQLNWLVRDDGTVLTRFTFVAKQPTQLVHLSLNPLQWGVSLTKLAAGGRIPAPLQPLQQVIDRMPGDLGFSPVFSGVDLLNAVTLGQAERQFCISRTWIIKSLLFVHFLQHYQMAIGSQQTWRQIPDWLDSQALPEFVLTGKSI